MVTPPPPLRPEVQLRKRIPTSFLKDDAAVNAFNMQLRTIVGEEEDRWEQAARTISKVAVTYERQLHATGLTQAVSLLDHCSTRHITPEATSFLRDQGLKPPGPEQAYNMLVALAERETQRTATERVMDNLHITLHFKRSRSRKPSSNERQKLPAW